MVEELKEGGRGKSGIVQSQQGCVISASDVETAVAGENIWFLAAKKCHKNQLLIRGRPIDDEWIGMWEWEESLRRGIDRKWVRHRHFIRA